MRSFSANLGSSVLDQAREPSGIGEARVRNEPDLLAIHLSRPPRRRPYETKANLGKHSKIGKSDFANDCGQTVILRIEAKLTQARQDRLASFEQVLRGACYESEPDLEPAA